MGTHVGLMDLVRNLPFGLVDHRDLVDQQAKDAREHQGVSRLRGEPAGGSQTIEVNAGIQGGEWGVSYEHHVEARS